MLMKDLRLWKLNRANKKNDNEAIQMNRILSDKSDFDTVETFKTIRTNIMFSLPKTNSGKVIAITSSSPGEGKTTTSVNLAITFAQMGAKVVLMDCDLRKARVHRYLQVRRDNGVSNVLCGFTELDRAIKKNVRDNLDILTAGEIPPNPAELLESPEFEKLVTELKRRYDYVFIDTPPVTVVTDGLVIAKQCMGIVVVVRENQTTFDFLDETMESLEKTDTKIVGVIMLGSENKNRKYGYYRKGRYGYKYGYKYKYGYNYRYGDEPKEGNADK